MAVTLSSYISIFPNMGGAPDFFLVRAYVTGRKL
jgi:hypothetical protein